MKHLPELVAAYTSMTPWARGKLLRAARDYLINWPLLPKKPLLTLVKSPAQVDVLPGRINGLIDQHAPLLISESIDGQ